DRPLGGDWRTQQGFQGLDFLAKALYVARAFPQAREVGFQRVHERLHGVEVETLRSAGLRLRFHFTSPINSATVPDGRDTVQSLAHSARRREGAKVGAGRTHAKIRASPPL